MSIPQPLPRSAILIVNAQSRKGENQFREACAKLRAAGVDIVHAHAVHDPDDLCGRVKEAVASKAPMVIVGGGDGSLSSAVDFFVGTETVFAFLPLGTANSFARSLGIPLDLDGAVDVIAHGVGRRVDLGMIDKDYFANCAAIGISPLIGETVPHKLKKYAGRPGYLAWALFQLSRFEPFRLTVGEGADAETVDALEVRIANGPFHGGTEVVENASIDSGEIIVQAVVGRKRSTLGLNWLLSALRLPSHKQTTREFRGKSLRVATEPPLSISIDGEVLAKTPVVARIAAGAILIAAPRTAVAARP